MFLLLLLSGLRCCKHRPHWNERVQSCESVVEIFAPLRTHVDQAVRKVWVRHFVVSSDMDSTAESRTQTQSQRVSAVAVVPNILLLYCSWSWSVDVAHSGTLTAFRSISPQRSIYTYRRQAHNPHMTASRLVPVLLQHERLQRIVLAAPRLVEKNSG
jgi:hypothetical protein